MSNEIVKHQTQSVSCKSMPSEKELIGFLEIAKTLSACPYYQKLGPHGILAIWLTARELNLPPMMCLNGGMYTFSGQVTLSSNLINMMIVNAGHRIEILKLDDQGCRIRFVRKDRVAGNNSFEYEYTTEHAQKAGLLNKNNWKTNLRDMLFNRTLSGGARKFMPDVMMGAYAIGEMPEDDNIVDVMPIPVVMDEVPKPKYITQEQINEIENLISECDPTKQEKINGFMIRKSGGDMKTFPLECYESAKKFVLQQRAEYLMSNAKITSMDEVADETN